MKSTNLIDPETIEKAKAVSIVGLLQSAGFTPIRESGGELLYRSPLRDEKTASFFVNPAKNCFCDFGGDQDLKGDSVKLARLLWRVGFKEAVKRLLKLQGLPVQSFSFSGLEPLKTPQKGIQVISVRKLQNPALIRYVEERKIPLQLATLYLKEVAYTTKGKEYFAVGFPNDAGGYELRNGLGFKGKTQNGITVFNKSLKSDSVLLFEGFFDFLSALDGYGRLYPGTPTIVLNTCNNLNKALPLLADRKVIHCCLDNDETGRKTVQRLIKAGFTVKDWSQITYPTCKDFNDYLIQYRNGSVPH